jgi:hypothetical protein
MLLVFLIIGLAGMPNLLDGNAGSITPDALTSGTINGIDYTHGSQDFYASGNFTQTANATITEISNVTKTETVPLPLLESYVPYDVRWRLDIFEYDPVKNETTYTLDHVNNQTYFAEIDFLTNTSRTDGMPWIFNNTDTINGFTQMNPVWENDTNSYETEIRSQDNEFLGKFPAGQSKFEYNHNYDNGTITRKALYIFPSIYYVQVSYKVFEIEMKSTHYSQAYMGYVARYSNAYNVSATAYQVNITDGENLAIGVGMFDHIEANFTEVISSYFGYYFLAFEVHELTFTNTSDWVYGNSSVPWEMYPKHLLPKSYQSDGVEIEVGWRKYETELLSTFQSITAAFASVSADVTDTQAQIEGNLAVWGLQTVNTLAAYLDGNNNGKFDLEVDKDGLKVGSRDKLEYLGLTEAYRSTVYNGYYHEDRYNESIQLHGLGVNITNTGVENITQSFDIYQEGYGNVDADVTTTFFFEEPTIDTDGNVVFDFGIDYENFPVTWINMTDPRNSFQENQDIKYHYIIKVNPDTGKAKMSTTWYYGGMEDPGFKEAMDGLSLSWIIKSEFFALRAVYTATLTNETINSTSTKAFGRLRVSFGRGEATEIDVTGPKSVYTVNSTQTESASFDAINLVRVSGSFSGERVTPFSSESEKSAGTATVGGLVENLDVDFFYSASLIIVSYPVWDGENIVHDPDYNVNYQPNAEEPTETTDTSVSSSTTTTDTEATSTSPSTKKDGGSSGGFLPGFGLIFTLSSLVIIVVKRKK